MAPPLSLADWLKSFRAIHERARTNKLSVDELREYRAARDELARALLSAQRLTVKPGETPRSSLRVARALQVALDMLTASARAITVDLCTGGFACLLAKAPSMGDEVGFSLRLPGADALS